MRIHKILKCLKINLSNSGIMLSERNFLLWLIKLQFQGIQIHVIKSRVFSTYLDFAISRNLPDPVIQFCTLFLRKLEIHYTPDNNCKSAGLQYFEGHYCISLLHHTRSHYPSIPESWGKWRYILKGKKMTLDWCPHLQKIAFKSKCFFTWTLISKGLVKISMGSFWSKYLIINFEII